ncbi:type II secretion system protein [Candidatus Saccharibacteria bacterium]|nr:type II secretion system protein [Candidatus Saccharibacteria bacterium]
MKKGAKKQGFTIIEVVLVLAVAGLIFTMVFIALPALQRSQRDNTRRDDLMKFVSEVKRYQTNNRGSLPGINESNYDHVDVVWSESMAGDPNTWAGFYRDYLGDRFLDPYGEHYKLTVFKCGGGLDVSCGDGYGSYLANLKTTAFGTSTPPNDFRILVVLQAKCDGIDVVGSSNTRNLAVLYRLEGSEAYCFNT